MEGTMTDSVIVSDLSRRHLLARLLGGCAAVFAGSRLLGAQAKPPMIVYKDAGCDCCAKWVEHMQKQGYKTTVSDVVMTPIKQKYKVPPKLQSCHTTIVANYVIEGHVPAADIAKLLAQKPKGVIGLTVPGMPASAPGMDMTPFRPYTVFTFDALGVTTVFAQHDKA
jgi:hypothetical protein